MSQLLILHEKGKNMNIIAEYINYLKDNPNRYWFKRKLYGWGWTPATWQGWLILGLFILFVIVVSFALPKEPTNIELIWFFVKIVTGVAMLILVCYKKGEKPTWQWGQGSK